MGNYHTKSNDTKTNGKKKLRVSKILKRFEMCPSGRQATINQKDTPQRPERKSYNVTAEEESPKNRITVTKKDSDWVDVPLSVPESPKRIQLLMSSDETPKVPPRKHLRKKKLITETTASPAKPEENKIPVEEPIIVPKKMPVHICDGTHHHTTNIPGEKHKHEEHVHQKEAKNTSEGPPQNKRPKTVSVVSLPDYSQLQYPPSKNGEKPSKPEHKVAKSRHISVASFPVDGKLSFSAATAERLESYITRCKSFGSLRTQQVIEQFKSQEQTQESDSEDSWDGLDDWDLGVIEHQYNGPSKIPPYVPSVTSKLPPTYHQIKSKTDAPDPPKITPLSLNVSTRIDETDEQTHSPVIKNQQLNFVRNANRRRESIDDFFVSMAPEPETLHPEEIDELIRTCSASASRRGSEVVSHGYDTKCYPFKQHEKDTSFKSDSFFSSALIENESHQNDPHFPFKNTNVATEDKPMTAARVQRGARRRSGSVNTDEIVTHLQSISFDNIITEEINGDNKELIKTEEESTPAPIAEANDHSNLLKIINENSLPLNHLISSTAELVETTVSKENANN